jgi:signal transduction histidine kinase
MTIKVLLLLFFTVVLSCAGDTIALSQDEQEYLNNKKEIKVCINPKGLPLYGYEKGKNLGILAEIMFLIEKKLPVTFVHVPVKTWVECIRLSREKRVDIAGMILTTPNKHEHLLVSHEVFDGHIGMATKIQEPLVDRLSEVRGKSIALLRGQKSIAQFAEKRLPYFRYIEVDSIKEGLELVAKGKVYGYVDDTYSLAYYILKDHSNTLKIMEKLNVKPLSVGVGIQKDAPLLLSMVNKAIDSIDDQEIKNIIHKWISVRVEKGFDYTLLLKIASLFLLILLVSLFWVSRLLSEVKRRKEVEQELKHLNENLENEVSSKMKELHYKDAMLLEKTKLADMGEMLGSVAHQWRRPLSTLHINIEMLEEDYKEGKIDKQFLDLFIQKNSDIIQYMSKTIDDFQNFYKIDKEKSRFDVMEKIESVLGLQLNQLESSGISIAKKGESFIVYGYPGEFQQVMLNLIGNAKDVLMSRKIQNPTIMIALSSEGNRGFIHITDNAGGIDEKILPKVCEPYFTTKGNSGGTGLGLYISKMIIEKNMHGRLSLSNRDRGCEVSIMLKKEES